ncbi:hypothetical protein [Pseudaestuariivita rosea]|uniref:hypothetical protein n=1 Tax=Pseudaestuariivita rosea TaxID=2763263 RepID=UPI001ABAD74C|nr:hypothetical protein [Pseudaestuariivita rosea]
MKLRFRNLVYFGIGAAFGMSVAVFATILAQSYLFGSSKRNDVLVLRLNEANQVMTTEQILAEHGTSIEQLQDQAANFTRCMLEGGPDCEVQPIRQIEPPDIEIPIVTQPLQPIERRETHRLLSGPPWPECLAIRDIPEWTSPIEIAEITIGCTKAEEWKKAAHLRHFLNELIMYDAERLKLHPNIELIEEVENQTKQQEREAMRPIWRAIAQGEENPTELFELCLEIRFFGIPRHPPEWMYMNNWTDLPENHIESEVIDWFDFLREPSSLRCSF